MWYSGLMTREDIIAIATRIAELRAEVSRLSGLQKELKKLEAELDTVTGVGPAPVATRHRANQSIEERVGELIESVPEKEWSPEEIAEKLGGLHIPTVRATFSKLRKAGRIVDSTMHRGNVRAAAQSAESPSAPKEEDQRLKRVA